MMPELLLFYCVTIAQGNLHRHAEDAMFFHLLMNSFLCFKTCNLLLFYSNIFTCNMIADLWKCVDNESDVRCSVFVKGGS